jgi:multidrug transporter EmrE-like cation transporter
MIYVLAFVSICLGAVGQFGLKVASGQLKLSDGVWAAILSYITNINIILSLLCFATSTVMWIFVLRKLELSIAYPMVSFGYIITMVLAFLFLHEPLRLAKIIGALLIVSGVVVINFK